MSHETFAAALLVLWILMMICAEVCGLEVIKLNDETDRKREQECIQEATIAMP